MSLSLDLKRIFREGLVTFWRNKIVSFSAILTMTMSLIVLFSLLLMNGVLDFSITQLQERVDVNIYFLPDAAEKDILDLQEKITLIPEVRDVIYLSKDNALAEFEARHADDDLVKRSLEELGDNPLGASLNIRAHNSNQYEAIVAAIQSEPMVTRSQLVEDINYHDNKKIIQRLNEFASIIRVVGFGIIITLAIVVILIIMSMMRIAIYSVRDEIIVKRLVGAEHRYIRGPFTIIGSLYGGVAGLLTLIILYPLIYSLNDLTKTFFGGMNILVYYTSNIMSFAIIIIGTGILLAYIASLISVRRYLKI